MAKVVNYGASGMDANAEPLRHAFAKVDAGARLFGVIDHALTSPPASPDLGDAYIVADGATGAWSGEAGNVAVWDGGAWRIVEAAQGMFAWIASEAWLYHHDGEGWVAFPTAGAHGLDDHSDVEIVEPDNGDVLTYDAAGERWIAAPPPAGEGGGGAANAVISDDVDEIVLLADQAAYDARDPPDEGTLYLVPEEA